VESFSAFAWQKAVRPISPCDARGRILWFNSRAMERKIG
jgi:hypothetical protein